MTAASNTPTDRCETCQYWVRGDVNATNGQCRAAPPATGADGTSSWPTVSARDWCGKHAAAGPRFDPEALSDALNAFSDAAGNFTDSLSRGVTGFFSHVRDTREQNRENKARSLVDDTRQLSTLLTEYIISWTNLPESDRTKVCDELTVVADEFLLSVGRPDANSAIELFLKAENRPGADRNRALAIDYLGLLEKSQAAAPRRRYPEILQGSLLG